MGNNGLVKGKENNAWLIPIADACFVLYVLSSFLCERTVIGRVALFLFILVVDFFTL